jgi:hypothetical protein
LSQTPSPSKAITKPPASPLKLLEPDKEWPNARCETCIFRSRLPTDLKTGRCVVKRLIANVVTEVEPEAKKIGLPLFTRKEDGCPLWK